MITYVTGLSGQLPIVVTASAFVNDYGLPPLLLLQLA